MLPENGLVCVRERDQNSHSPPGHCRIEPEWPMRPTTASALISVGASLLLVGWREAGDVIAWSFAT